MGGNSGQVILLPSFYTPSKHRLSERVERLGGPLVGHDMSSPIYPGGQASGGKLYLAIPLLLLLAEFPSRSLCSSLCCLGGTPALGRRCEPGLLQARSQDTDRDSPGECP